MKIQKKKLIKWAMVLKTPLLIYLIISLLIVPNIHEINAEVIYGAHRGSSIEYEENTLEAFEKAIHDPKYEFIEFDITYTKDNKIIAIHQNNYLRFPKKGIIVRNTNYNEIEESFDYHVPQYNEVMEILAGKKPLDIEIKSTKDFEKDKKLVDFVIADCKEKGILDEIMISSISDEVIEYIEKNHPEIKTGRVYWVTLYSIAPAESLCDNVYNTPADYVLLHGYNIYNYEKLVQCKPENKDLMFWYFTDEVYIVKDNNCHFWQK